MKVSFAEALAFCFVLTIPVTVNAKTLYVKCGMDDYAGHNGTTWELAYETIQEAINASASGDLILVHSGVYNKGVGRTTNPTHWWGKSRIFCSGSTKSLTIKSSKGDAADTLDPENTIIEGEYDPSGANGFGAEAYRCIQVETTTTATNQLIFQGFTLRGGRTKDSHGNSPGHGAALQCSVDGNNSCYNTYIVDCIIKDCIGGMSVTLGGTFVRCRFTDTAYTWAPASTGQTVLLTSGSRLMNCLFDNNRTVDPVTHEPVLTSFLFGNGSKFVNCTLMGNLSCFWNANTTHWYNTVDSTTRLPTDDGAIHANRHSDSTTKCLLIAPTLGDYRVRKGSDAETGGSAQYLADTTEFPLPDAIDRFRDIDNNPIPTTGTICVGCCQTVIEPAGGCLYSNLGNLYFDDTTNTYYQGGVYVWAATYPTNYRVRVVANRPEASESGRGVSFFRLSGTGLDNVASLRYPSWRDDIYLAPSPDNSVKIKIEPQITTNIAYALPGADASTADGSLEHPYPTLQQAYDKYDSNDMIVRALPGVYNEGGAIWDGHNVRIYSTKVGVRIASTEGPEKTIIMGARDETSPDGCGTNATLLIAITSNTGLSGFTLTGGYSPANGSARRPIYSYGVDLTVSDCIITNNHGRHYAVGTAAFERCLIKDNYGADYVLVGSRLYSCIVEGNHLTNPDAIILGDMNASIWANYNFNCTLIGDGIHNMWDQKNAASRRINTIVDNGGPIALANGINAGNIYNGFAVYEPTISDMIADPMLCDGYKVFSKSPALYAAANPADDASCPWWYLCQTDFTGKPLRYDANGRVICGALQECVTGGVYVCSGNGGLALDGGAFGFTATDDFESITVSMTAGATRPLVGIDVNGTTNLFTVANSSFTVTPAQLPDGDFAISPLYSNLWYVDAVNGSRANYGYNREFPAKTLMQVLTNAYVQAGDKVMALPGTYDEDAWIQPGDYTIRARAIVPDGVALESTDGAADTVIKGCASDIDEEMSEGFTASYGTISGLGTNAIRCVYLMGGAASVKGFTLKDGYTRVYNPSGAVDHYHSDTCGGGVFSKSSQSQVTDCIFTNCAAFRGGGAMYGRHKNCRYYGNRALYGGGAASETSQYDCLTKNNSANYANGAYANFLNLKDMDRCTMLDRTCLFGNTRNSLVLGNVSIYGSYTLTNMLTNVVFNASKTIQQKLKDLINGGYAPGCQMVTEDNLQVDADFRPVIGANAAIDAGLASVSQYMNETDYTGVQRIYNGALDCGALEADWRNIYRDDIGKARYLAVTTASPGVVETEAQTVKLPDGASLTAEVTADKSGENRYTVTGKVIGAGTLTVLLNGEPFNTISGGECDLTFRNNLEHNQLDFTFDGEGYAELLRISIGNRGAVIRLR
jgi:hypothetical protein